MRPANLATLAIIFATLGGTAALLVGAALGWVGPERTQTVIAPLAAEPPPPTPAAVRSPGRPLSGNGFDPARLYAARARGVVTVYALFDDHVQSGAGGQGSGFVVSKDGVLLTNAHVVTEDRGGDELAGADDVYVEFADGDRAPATLVGWDAYADVAVLRVDRGARRLRPLPLGDSTRIAVGDPVAAIGSPFGEQGSLSVGVVSATDRSISALVAEYRLAGAIQTDAPINRGNSGGPLFDARGRVIGINAQIRSNSGTAEGVGFAIPINAVKRSLSEILRHGRVSYAYLGVLAEDVTPSLARRLRLPVSAGALVVTVKAGPAQEAGLRGGSRTLELAGRRHRIGGDIVVAIAGEPIRNSTDLVRAVTERLRPGQLVTVTVVRGGKRIGVPVTLAERPGDSTG
jgi:S1-C subfamily serine protease